MMKNVTITAQVRIEAGVNVANAYIRRQLRLRFSNENKEIAELSCI